MNSHGFFFSTWTSWPHSLQRFDWTGKWFEMSALQVASCNCDMVSELLFDDCTLCMCVRVRVVRRCGREGTKKCSFKMTEKTHPCRCLRFILTVTTWQWNPHRIQQHSVRKMYINKYIEQNILFLITAPALHILLIQLTNNHHRAMKNNNYVIVTPVLLSVCCHAAICYCTCSIYCSIN